MADVAGTDISHSKCVFEEKVGRVEKQMWLHHGFIATSL